MEQGLRRLSDARRVLYQGRAIRIRGFQADGRAIELTGDVGAVLPGIPRQKPEIMGEQRRGEALDPQPDRARERGKNQAAGNQQNPRNQFVVLVRDPACAERDLEVVLRVVQQVAVLQGTGPEGQVPAAVLGGQFDALLDHGIEADTARPWSVVAVYRTWSTGPSRVNRFPPTRVSPTLAVIRMISLGNRSCRYWISASVWVGAAPCRWPRLSSRTCQ